MMKKELKGNMMLLLCAVIWGSAFVAQSEGMKYVKPFTFQAVRSFIGCAVLLPVIFMFGKVKKEDEKKQKNTGSKKTLITGGIICGIALCTASMFQQFGIATDASAGDAGFITALYILIVPIVSMAFGKKTGAKIWIGVVAALVGLYLMTDKFNGFTQGCLLVLVSAFIFSAHIMVVDYFSPKVDGVKLSCIQFFVSGIIAGIFMLILEKPQLSDIMAAWLPILYAGAMSSGVAYTLQILGQKYTNPTVASMIMSLESVFAMLSGMIFQSEQNPVVPIKLVGCFMIFAAIIVAQLPDKKVRT